MCIGFPGEVLQVDPQGATVRTEDRMRRASTLLLPDVTAGDWVYVAAGTIIERLSAEEAADIQRTLREAMALEEEQRERPASAVASTSERGA